MLFGQAVDGVFPEKLTRNNEHGIPEKAIILQTIIVTVLLAATSIFPGVDVIYNVLVTMTALTSLFPYVLLFLAYIKIKREKDDSGSLYLMTKNKKIGIGLGWMELIVCCIAIVLSAYPVMGNLKDNLIYEIEMVGGGFVVLLSGMYIWKHSGLENIVKPVRSIPPRKMN